MGYLLNRLVSTQCAILRSAYLAEEEVKFIQSRQFPKCFASLFSQFFSFYYYNFFCHSSECFLQCRRRPWWQELHTTWPFPQRLTSVTTNVVEFSRAIIDTTAWWIHTQRSHGMKTQLKKRLSLRPEPGTWLNNIGLRHILPVAIATCSKIRTLLM